MTETLVFLQILVAVATLATILYGLYRMIRATAEARAGRETAHTNIMTVIEAVAQVKEQTNGMSHRLETLAGEAGEGRGRAQAEAEAREDAKNP